MWDAQLDTRPSLRCLGTSALAITSRRKQLHGHGSWQLRSMYSSFILHGVRSPYWWIISCSSEKFTICLRITKEMPFILICFSNIRVVLSIVRHELVLTCSSFTWKDNTSIFTINDCVYKTWPGDQCWCISVWFRSVLMICMLSFTFLVTKQIFYPYVFSSFDFTSSWIYLVLILFI